MADVMLDDPARMKAALITIIKTNNVNFESPEHAAQALNTIEFWQSMYQHVRNIALEGLGLPAEVFSASANDNGQTVGHA